MNCACIKDLEEKLKTRVQDNDTKPWKDAILDSLQCQGVVLVWSTGAWTLTIPFKTEWHRITKAGGKQRRTDSISMQVSFCPFCGVKTTRDWMPSKDPNWEEREGDGVWEIGNGLEYFSPMAQKWLEMINVGSGVTSGNGLNYRRLKKEAR